MSTFQYNPDPPNLPAFSSNHYTLSIMPADLAFRHHKYLIVILLFFASLHCGRSAFMFNVSVINLRAYAAGLERTPYQSRVGMIPVLRWAGANSTTVRIAHYLEMMRLKGSFGLSVEPLSPEKLTCIVLGCIAVLSMVFSTVRYCNSHFPELWWLGGVFVLVILYVTYAARSEANFWYPYDLPHFALVGLACIALLEDAWLPFAIIFCCDLALRETSLFILTLGLIVAVQDGRWRMATACSLLGLMVWLPFNLWAAQRFQHNPTELGVHWRQDLHTITNPLHWPQFVSALAFLTIPLWLGRRRLSSRERMMLYAASACTSITLVYGVWYESRIFDEWTVLVSILLVSQVSSVLKGQNAAAVDTQEVAITANR